MRSEVRMEVRGSNDDLRCVQAVAWAAAQVGLPCTVVVPRGTPKVKVRSS